MKFKELNGDTLVYTFRINYTDLAFNTYFDFYFNYTDGAGNNYFTRPFVTETGDIDEGYNSVSAIRDKTAPEEVEPDNFEEVRVPGRAEETNELVVYTNETISEFNITYAVQDINGVGLSNVTVNWYHNGSLIPNLAQNYMIGGEVIWSNASSFADGIYTLNITAPSEFFQDNSFLTYEIDVTDKSGNSLTLNEQNDPESNSFNFQPPPQPEQVEEPEEPLPEPEDIEEPVTVEETVITVDDEGNEITIINTTVIQPASTQEENNALWIIAGFLGLLGLLTLYYQRNNIIDMIRQKQRRQKVKGALSDIIKEIRQLGEDKKFKRAILLIWDALERVSKEVVNATRPFNVTARQFTAYLSTVTVVDRETLLTLSDTFELARYGNEQINKDTFENAINALENTIESIIKSGARSVVIDDDEDW